MKTLVEMSKEHFDRLLAKCTASDREYEIMKNGLVMPYGENGNSPQTMVILCEEAEATLILDLARRLYPVAAKHLRQYPAAE